MAKCIRPTQLEKNTAMGLTRGNPFAITENEKEHEDDILLYTITQFDFFLYIPFVGGGCDLPLTLEHRVDREPVHMEWE